jgi:hypothetical protein
MKNHLLKSKEPDFPRPSSAIARGRLHNRLVLKQTKKIILPKNNHEGNIDAFENDTDLTQQPFLGYPSMTNDSLVYFDPPEPEYHPHDEAIKTMKSNIIHSHSLMVPGIESLYLSQSQIQHSSVSHDFGSQTTAHYIQLISQENKINPQHNSLEEAIRLIMTGVQEFCYLEAKNPSNPYELTLTSTPSNPSNPRYITLSKNWITRHGKGEPDQCSLKSFLKEYYVYHQIIKIHLFKQFSEWYDLSPSLPPPPHRHTLSQQLSGKLSKSGHCTLFDNEERRMSVSYSFYLFSL